MKASYGLPSWLREGVMAAELEQKTIPKYITAVSVLGLPDLSAGGIYA